MQIQTVPLIPDVEYFLDAALEHGEIDGGSHVALRLYAPRRDLTDIIDGVPPVGEYLASQALQTRLSICGRLMLLADCLLADLDAERRGAIAWAGVEHLRTEATTLAWTLATWAHEDSIIGGCLLPWKRGNSRFIRDYELTPKQARRLYGREWIARYVRHNSDALLLRRRGTRALRRIAGVSHETVRSAAETISRDMQSQHEGYRRFNERIMRQWGQKQIPSNRDSRKVIKRAASTAVSIIGTAAVSAFARGEPVVLSGESISLEVARRGSSATLGHAGLHITAVDKDTSRRLADLCVYHERTPALDQLTALALAMQSGDECEVLATANLSRVTDLGRAHPLIGERGVGEPRWQPRDERQKGNERYWQATKEIWLERLGVFVLGRQWRDSA